MIFDAPEPKKPSPLLGWLGIGMIIWVVSMVASLFSSAEKRWEAAHPEKEATEPLVRDQIDDVCDVASGYLSQRGRGTKFPDCHADRDVNLDWNIDHDLFTLKTYVGAKFSERRYYMLWIKHPSGPAPEVMCVETDWRHSKLVGGCG